MKITIRERPGHCRWCGCTYNDPCPPGCSWANRQQTLCSECVELDKMIRTVEGRRDISQGLAVYLEEHGD